MGQQKLERLARELGLIPDVSFVGREDGYHAVHVVVSDEFVITAQDWTKKTVRTALEIQVTTQLKYAILDLLREVYEERRLSGMPENWKWNWDSKEFNAGYLGHTVHLLEGIIVRVREIGNHD